MLTEALRRIRFNEFLSMNDPPKASFMCTCVLYKTWLECIQIPYTKYMKD